MEVRFIRKNKGAPGEQAIVEAELEAVPRQGDWVFFSENDAAEQVIHVTWFIPLSEEVEDAPYAIVYV